MGVKVFIKGQEVPKKTIKDWEQKRVDFISDFLTKELGTPKVATAEELTDLKMTIPEQKMREITARNCKSNDVTSGMLAKSRGARLLFVKLKWRSPVPALRRFMTSISE